MQARQYSDAQKALILQQGNDGSPWRRLPQGRDQPGDLFQPGEDVRSAVAGMCREWRCRSAGPVRLLGSPAPRTTTSPAAPSKAANEQGGKEEQQMVTGSE